MDFYGGASYRPLFKKDLLKDGGMYEDIGYFFQRRSWTHKKSCRGTGKKLDAVLFEIIPEKPYTKADLSYMNPLARCNREKFGKKDVPVSGRVEHFSDYDTVYIGFPIWYGAAPNVMNTFCSAYDWTGKKVHAFATSGGSGIGKTAEKLVPYLKGVESVDAKLVHNAEEL